MPQRSTYLASLASLRTTRELSTGPGLHRCGHAAGSGGSGACPTCADHRARTCRACSLPIPARGPTRASESSQTLLLACLSGYATKVITSPEASRSRRLAAKVVRESRLYVSPIKTCEDLFRAHVAHTGRSTVRPAGQGHHRPQRRDALCPNTCRDRGRWRAARRRRVRVCGRLRAGAHGSSSSSRPSGRAGSASADEQAHKRGWRRRAWGRAWPPEDSGGSRLNGGCSRGAQHCCTHARRDRPASHTSLSGDMRNLSSSRLCAPAPRTAPMPPAVPSSSAEGRARGLTCPICSSFVLCNPELNVPPRREAQRVVVRPNQHSSLCRPDHSRHASPTCFCNISPGSRSFYGGKRER